MAVQKGLLLTAADHKVKALELPSPPSDHNLISAQAYKTLLPAADPQHLLLAAVPFAELVGQRVVLLFDASSSGEPNKIATRLTTNVENGLEIQICGDALAFYAEPGRDMSPADWQQLDNVIYDELTEYFQQGTKPTPADVQQLVANFKAGRYDYRQHEGEEGEDVNKDDAGEDLQDALQDE